MRTLKEPKSWHATRNFGLFGRINLHETISLKYINTKDQIAHLLAKGQFTVHDWTALTNLFNQHQRQMSWLTTRNWCASCSLGLVFVAINIDASICTKHINTKVQIEDRLTNGQFAEQRWTTVARLFDIHAPVSADCVFANIPRRTVCRRFVCRGCHTCHLSVPGLERSRARN